MTDPGDGRRRRWAEILWALVLMWLVIRPRGDASASVRRWLLLWAARTSDRGSKALRGVSDAALDAYREEV